MNIGVDIDNVISNFNDELLSRFLIHDKELRNTGIINNDAYITRGMFDWSQEETDDFYKNNIEEIANNLETIEGASYYINKLMDLGHKIYIITGRDNGEYSDPYTMTSNWLSKNNINYDELILTNSYTHSEKATICIEKNIDLMVDDSIHVYIKCMEKNIPALIFDTQFNRKDNSLKRINNWKELYEYIKNNNKFNVILDTDIDNECDDHFALSYMLKSQDIFNIEAITIAPFSHNHEKKVTAMQGQEYSYNEAIKICNYLNFDITNKLFKGSTDFMVNGYYESNNAVNKIIEIALKNEKTYIMAIGAITNVALAIKKEPKIIDRIEIIWLGGNSLSNKDNIEYNFRQDIEAIKLVLCSKVNITIVPCDILASSLKISLQELKSNIENTNQLCNYLISRFINDGYSEPKESRVIWDISVIAYMINKNWFQYDKIHCPIVNEDTSYLKTYDSHLITMVTSVDSNKIYKDLFNKLQNN